MSLPTTVTTLYNTYVLVKKIDVQIPNDSGNTIVNGVRDVHSTITQGQQLSSLEALTTIAKECDKNPYCNAFNTEAYLKKSQYVQGKYFVPTIDNGTILTGLYITQDRYNEISNYDNKISTGVNDYMLVKDTDILGVATGQFPFSPDLNTPDKITLPDASTMRALAAQCDSNPDCKGFTNYGYLKKSAYVEKDKTSTVKGNMLYISKDRYDEIYDFSDTITTSKYTYKRKSNSDVANASANIDSPNQNVTEELSSDMMKTLAIQCDEAENCKAFTSRGGLKGNNYVNAKNISPKPNNQLYIREPLYSQIYPNDNSNVTKSPPSGDPGSDNTGDNGNTGSDTKPGDKNNKGDKSSYPREGLTGWEFGLIVAGAVLVIVGSITAAIVYVVKHHKKIKKSPSALSLL